VLIQRADIDLQVVEALSTQIASIVSKPNPTEAERRALSAMQTRFQNIFLQQRQAWFRSLAWVLGGMLAGFLVGLGMLATGDPEGAVAAGVTMGLAGTLIGVGSGVYARRTQRVFMQEANRLHSDLLAAWLPLVALPRAERAYAEALVQLAALESLDEPTARDILSQLNGLMSHHRQLETQRERIRAALGGNSAETLEAERAELRRRAEDANDPATKQALQESLRICEARLQQAKALEPALHRLDAQREVIVQTLASVQVSLTRLQAAPAAISAPDVEEITQTVAQISTQAQAVEQAVQEVMTLRVE